MSILLINPPVYDFAAFDLWSKPVGLLYVAAGLRAAGYHVTLLDCMDRCAPEMTRLGAGARLKPDEFGTGHFYSQQVAKPDALAPVPRRYKRYGLPRHLVIDRLHRLPEPQLALVGSVMTYWYPGVQDAIACVREQWPRVPVALGGIYATLCAKHAEQTSGADWVVPGPGIEAAIEIAERVVGPANEFGRSTDLLVASPAFDLYPRLDTAAVLTSVGCPFRCTYCAARLLQPGFAQRDVDEVVRELAGHAARGVRDIAFYDDALLGNAGAHFLPLAAELGKRPLGLRFHTPNGLHPRFVTSEVAAAMKRVGFATVRLSLESTNERWQQQSGRKVTSAEFADAVERLVRAGFDATQIAAYLLAGRAGQAFDEIEASIRFVHKTGVQVSLAEYSPIPGTPDFANAMQRLPAVAAEPLLHNNTVYSLLAGELPAGAMQEAKDLARRLNAKVRAQAQ